MAALTSTPTSSVARTRLRRLSPPPRFDFPRYGAKDRRIRRRLLVPRYGAKGRRIRGGYTHKSWTAATAHWAGADKSGALRTQLVSGLPTGRRRSRVARQLGAFALVVRLRQRLGGGGSRKQYLSQTS